MASHVLAYDLGTGGVKASLHNEAGEALAACFESYETSYPRPGFHEQNPLDWWEGVVQSTRNLLERSGIDPKSIVSLAVSGHSLGVVPIGVDGALLHTRLPIWSDGRAMQQAQKFFKTASPDEWYMTTGNGFPAGLYSIFKLMWFQENMPEVFSRTAKFIGTKDYINYRLTGTLATDFSYASGSGVYGLKTWKYREDYIRISGVPANKLPEIVSSSEVLGTLLPEAAKELGLGEHVKVACGGVDNACMCLGAGCITDGAAYTSVGSSAWIAVAGHEPILDTRRKPYVFTHCVPEMFVSSTAIFAAGSCFRWLRDTVCRDLLSQPEPYDAMAALAAQSPLGSNKLIFNPSLAGGSSLDKSPNIKGGFIGLQLGHTQADLIRSVMEGVCLNLRIALDAMQEYTPVAEDMLIVGGGGKSKFWRSLFADIYEKGIVETNIGQDAGSLGAAAVAAVGVGLWHDYSPVPKLHVPRSRLEPERENAQRYRKVLAVFSRIAGVQADIGDMIEQAQW